MGVGRSGACFMRRRIGRVDVNDTPVLRFFGQHDGPFTHGAARTPKAECDQRSFSTERMQRDLLRTNAGPLRTLQSKHAPEVLENGCFALYELRGRICRRIQGRLLGEACRQSSDIERIERGNKLLNGGECFVHGLFLCGQAWEDQISWRLPTPLAVQNAEMPVCARPRINACTSCVPS
jgi:hypothetical protein